MQNLEEFKTENWSTDASGPAFIVRATIKGLELLAGILVIAREVRDALREIQDMQSCQEQPLIPEEAMQILRISKTKLGNLKSSGAHINGVHYWQDGDIVRYFPDFASKPLKPVEDEQKETTTSDDNVTHNSQCAIDPNA